MGSHAFAAVWPVSWENGEEVRLQWARESHVCACVHVCVFLCPCGCACVPVWLCVCWWYSPGPFCGHMGSVSSFIGEPIEPRAPVTGPKLPSSEARVGWEGCVSRATVRTSRCSAFLGSTCRGKPWGEVLLIWIWHGVHFRRNAKSPHRLLRLLGEGQVSHCSK